MGAYLSISKNGSLKAPVIGGYMEQSIKDIKHIFQAADIEKLPEFIHSYRQDTRSGVQEILRKSEKKLADLECEMTRIEQLKIFEKQYECCGYVCGIDEVGRGPLAGPVMAGAVILPKDCKILYLNDSKQLSEKRREELYCIIKEQAVATGIGLVGPERIDEINILQATYEAMRLAISNLGIQPDILLNDAVTIPGVEIRQIPIIKGDAKSVSIAAASILAKVTRDRLMCEYAEIYPEYGFDQNKGYGAAIHIEALRKYGPTSIHRRSFIGNFI